MPYTLSDLPERVDYKAGAALVTRYFFPVSDRTLERWQLKSKLIVNGRCTFETAEVLAQAEARLEGARTLRLSTPAA